LSQLRNYFSLSSSITLNPSRKPSHVSVERLKFEVFARRDLCRKRRFAAARTPNHQYSRGLREQVCRFLG
jgi:hypothetical protein